MLYIFLTYYSNMALHNGAILRDIEVSLSIGYLFVWVLALAEFIALPLGFLPAGTVTLVLPGILALTALVVVLTDEFRLSTGIIGGLALVTFVVAAWGIYGFLVVAEQRLFWGAVLTLIATVPLTLAILGLEFWRKVPARVTRATR